MVNVSIITIFGGPFPKNKTKVSLLQKKKCFPEKEQKVKNPAMAVLKIPIAGSKRPHMQRKSGQF